jgi:hypothetical protein
MCDASFTSVDNAFTAGLSDIHQDAAVTTVDVNNDGYLDLWQGSRCTLTD